MKNIKIVILTTLISFLFSSCATNYEEEKSALLSKDESSDLVTTFEAEGQQNQILKNDKEEIQLTNKEIIPKIKKSKSRTKKKVDSKGIVDKDSKVTQIDQSIVSVVKEELLPPDYPEEYKSYDAKSKNAWDKFKPIFYQGEQSIMAVTYLGVTAGYITILSKEVVKLNGKEAFHYFARFKSSDSYRYLYWLDDKLDTYVEKETFLPIKYSLVQREKKQNVDDLQLFDFKKMMTYNWYKRVKEGSNKDEKGEARIPSLAQDSFSALQFVRGLPLIKGDKYELPVVTRGKFWILKVEVMGEETVVINDVDTQAIKIKAETNFPGVLKKSGDINFWYGADSERRLLKFQAKVKIGSLYGELVEYKPGIKVQ